MEKVVIAKNRWTNLRIELHPHLKHIHTKSCPKQSAKRIVPPTCKHSGSTKCQLSASYMIANNTLSTAPRDHEVSTFQPRKTVGLDNTM
jgi:hypothetical protein